MLILVVTFFSFRKNQARFSIAAHASGLDVAFLPGVFFEHTGEKVSAYRLNGFSRAWDSANVIGGSSSSGTTINSSVVGAADAISRKDDEDDDEAEFKALKWDQNKLFD
jgi:hypothetical protein